MYFCKTQEEGLSNLWLWFELINGMDFVLVKLLINVFVLKIKVVLRRSDALVRVVVESPHRLFLIVGLARKKDPSVGWNKTLFGKAKRQSLTETCHPYTNRNR